MASPENVTLVFDATLAALKAGATLSGLFGGLMLIPII